MSFIYTGYLFLIIRVENVELFAFYGFDEFIVDKEASFYLVALGVFGGGHGGGRHGGK